MKALSVHQPWASAITNGSKTIETRTWRTDYRGDLLIVSAKKPIVSGLSNGLALCVVELVDCRKMTIADEKRACCNLYPGAWSWCLANVRVIDPFPVSGRQRLFEVPDLNFCPHGSKQDVK